MKSYEGFKQEGRSILSGGRMVQVGCIFTHFVLGIIWKFWMGSRVIGLRILRIIETGKRDAWFLEGRKRSGSTVI